VRHHSKVFVANMRGNLSGTFATLLIITQKVLPFSSKTFCPSLFSFFIIQNCLKNNYYFIKDYDREREKREREELTE